MRQQSGLRFVVLYNNMLNLLPFIENKKVRTEYRFRLAVVSIFAVSFLVSANLILLIPSYIRAFQKHALAEEQLAVAAGRSDVKNKRELAEKEANAIIKEINKKLSLFASGQKESEIRLIPAQVFKKIINLKTPAVKIFGIIYEVSPERERFVINGQSDDRDSLALFADTLKKDPAFTSVELPLSSYAKSKDINFAMVVERSYKIDKPAGKTR